MRKNKISRRKFIKITSVTTAGLAIESGLIHCTSPVPYDPKGLPTRTLGKTGVKIPLIAIGTGSRFCAVKKEDKALEILTYALDNGLYYWDTAHIYAYDSIVSEKRLGSIIKDRRKEVFLSTKISARDPEKAKEQIERSLVRLQTDHVDILKVHSIENLDDLQEITKKGGLYDVLRSLKEQGIAKFIGYSGHNSDVAMAEAAKNFDFDTMLVALNHYSDDGDDFEQKAVSAAAKKDMGVMVMKVIRPRETVTEIAVSDLIRYALSLKQAHGAVIGIDNMNVLKENIELLKTFKPFDSQKMDDLRASLSPFYRNKNLEWMHHGYKDGNWT